MTKTLSLSEVKMKLSELVDKVAKRDDEVVITRNGKPIAVIISSEEHDSWKETQEIKKDPELMSQIKASVRALSKKEGFKSYTLDELFG